MDIYVYNTDAVSLDGPPRYGRLIKRGYAVTGGPTHYGKQLGRLSPDDRLLMYEDRIGCVAIGKVIEPWDGKKHSPPWYYDDGHEYRIKVNWHRLAEPITIDRLRSHIGTIQPRTLFRIVKGRRPIERLLAKQSER